METVREDNLICENVIEIIWIGGLNSLQPSRNVYNVSRSHLLTEGELGA